MKIGYKVWLDNDGKAFGDGPCELLERVEGTHSLHQAAKEMGMAYSTAWRLLPEPFSPLQGQWASLERH